MVSLQKSGDSAVKFVFENSPHYLYGNGEIEIPINSLILVEDGSDMITFKKIDGDVFISATLGEFGMSKAEIETFYETNMVGSTGGGGGDITSGEVQTMIDESISGKADTSAVTESISAATDDMATKTWVGQQGYLTEHQSLSAYSTTEEMNTAISEATSGKADTSAVTAVNDALTAHTADTTIHVTSADKTAWNAKSDFSGSYNDLTDKPTIPTSASQLTNDAGYITSDALSGYAESSAVTEEISAATSGKVDSSSVVTAVTSASTDSEIPTAKAVFDAVGQGGGGGKAIEAGRGISITTGETADTVSFNLPISAGTGDNSIIFGVGCKTNGSKSFAGGQSSTGSSEGSFVFGQNCKADQWAVAIGNGVDASNVRGAAAFGEYNVANGNRYSDLSATTFFSVGNGSGLGDRHNAFEIRKNGDIYITSGGTDIKLQDNLGGGGGSVTIDPSLDSGSTNAVANSAITAAINAKQDALVSGTNIKTINNESILGSGNITIQGGGSGSSTVELTQAEYDALVSGGTVDPNTYYIITDADPINLSGYAQTSAVTEEIAAAVSGKADTSAVTASITEATSGLQETLVSGTNIKTINNESILGSGNITIQGGGGGMTEDTERLLSTALVELNDRKIDASDVKTNYQKKGDYATKSEVALKANASEVMTLEKSKENELVTAKALNSINERLIALETAVQALQALHNNE